MTISSMTGFARAEGATEACAWRWEARSVNGRGLDIGISLPPDRGALEGGLRAIASAAFTRGKLGFSLRISRSPSAPRHQVNLELLEDLVAVARGHAAGGGEVSVERLLAVPGVVEAPARGAEPDVPDEDLVAGFRGAVEALAAMRRDEGARLAGVAGALLDDIAGAAARASDAAPRAVEERSRQLRARLEELLAGEAGVPEERLVQEAALVAARGDVREELDRLGAHIEAFRALLEGGGAVGRRMDFLCQELNREANTLCSKSPGVGLTRAGIDLKAAIERLREQIQNLE